VQLIIFSGFKSFVDPTSLKNLNIYHLVDEGYFASLNKPYPPYAFLYILRVIINFTMTLIILDYIFANALIFNHY